MTITLDQLFDLTDLRDPERSAAMTALRQIGETEMGQRLFADIQARHSDLLARGGRIDILNGSNNIAGVDEEGPVIFLNHQIILDEVDFGMQSGQNGRLQVIDVSYQAVLFHELAHLTEDMDAIDRENQREFQAWFDGLAPAVQQDLRQRNLATMDDVLKYSQEVSENAVQLLPEDTMLALASYEWRLANMPAEMRAINRTNEFTHTHFGETMRYPIHWSIFRSMVENNRNVDMQQFPFMGDDHVYPQIANIALNSPELRSVIVNAQGWSAQFDSTNNGLDDAEINRAKDALDRNDNGVYDYADYASLVQMARDMGVTNVNLQPYEGNAELMRDTQELLQSLPQADRGGRER